ncbi:MAG TPA: hypothetical protein VMH39_16380, partial [Gemmatimonadaceae bacterium]|nr:hypothetical protein [Gemmatimonadaceae bacterium]
NLAAGVATQITLSTPPSASAASGAVFAQQPVLQLRDDQGNAVSLAGITVTAAIASGAGGALGGATQVQTAAAGTATFAGLSITGPTGPFTLSFSASGLTGTTSGTIAITAATQLTITTQPSAAPQNGVVFPVQPVIQLRDANGNAVGQAGVMVTAAIASGGGTLGTTLTAATNAAGVATFTDLAITGVIGSRTLSFTSGGLTPVTSSVVNLAAGVATQITLSSTPSATAASSAAFAQQPVLQLRDAAGNAVSLASYTVTAAITAGSGTLGGATQVVTAATGIATFAGLSITGTIGTFTLSFTTPGLTGASASITLTPGAATQLVLVTQPAGAASGVAFTQQPVAQLRDAAGNNVNQSGTVVTAAINTGPTGLSGTLTATTNASGTATFTNLTLTGSGTRTLSFTSGALTSAISINVVVP